MGTKLVLVLAVVAVLGAMSLGALEQRRENEAAAATASPAWSLPPAMEAHLRRSFPH